MRTTIVVLITDSKRAVWAHVGDSRLYCFEDGRIVSRTSDHSVVQAMVDAGELSPDQIRHHEDRSRLLRCLGNPNGDLRPTILEHPRNLARGTSFLMCTDGFWENVTETEMEVDFTKAEAPGDWLQWMTDRVMDRITEESDNYTAIVAAFNSTRATNSRSTSKSPIAINAQPAPSKESRATRTSLSAPLVRAPNTTLPCASNWSRSVKVESNSERRAQSL
jgi:serine/threonine protein phosphatase PrpC